MTLSMKSTRDNLVRQAITTRVCPMCNAAMDADELSDSRLLFCTREIRWWKMFVTFWLKPAVGCGFVVTRQEFEAHNSAINQTEGQ